MAIAGNASEPQTAPIWLPVWRTENTSARRSSVTSLPSNAVLAGVSGPKARPRQSPARSSAGPDPNDCERHAGDHGAGAETCHAQRTDTVDQAAGPKRCDDADGKYRRREHRKAGNTEMQRRAQRLPVQTAQAPRAPAATSWPRVLAVVLADLPLVRVSCGQGLADRRPRGRRANGRRNIHSCSRCRERASGAGLACRDLAH